MLTRRFVLAPAPRPLRHFHAAHGRCRREHRRRFVFIIQRGAADGLSIVGPTGDPHSSERARRVRSRSRPGVKLGSFFTLHPALVDTAQMYSAKEALFVHAVASPYRDRSHFDGQNVLETGGSAAYQLRDGWLNRLLGLLPSEELRRSPFPTPSRWRCAARNQVSSTPRRSLWDPATTCFSASLPCTRVTRSYMPWSEAVATQMTAGDVDGADETVPRSAASRPSSLPVNPVRASR